MYLNEGQRSTGRFQIGSLPRMINKEILGLYINLPNHLLEIEVLYSSYVY